METSEERFISFHADGRAAGIGPEGDLPFPAAFKSEALFRFRLVEGEVVDLFEGLDDDKALEKDVADKAAVDRANAVTAAKSQPYTLFKTTLIERMTDPELEIFDKVYQQQNLRGRRMWDDCVSLVSTDPYFGLLRQLFTASYKATRAEELLAPII